jgi:hypothetical protein
MSKKVAKKKVKSTLTAEDRAAIIKVINKTRDLVGTVLECGGAMTHDCHEVTDLARELGDQLGFKRENWYSDFE